MPRKGPATRREIVGDPIYKSVLVTQFVNKILQRGKRSTAERIMYDALDLVQEKTGDDPVSVLKRAVDNVRPQLEVRSRRVGGATYQVPVEVRPRRATTLAIVVMCFVMCAGGYFVNMLALPVWLRWLRWPRRGMPSKRRGEQPCHVSRGETGYLRRRLTREPRRCEGTGATPRSGRRCRWCG